MHRNRAWLALALLFSITALPSIGQARCAPPSVREEVRRSTYVFEGTYLGEVEGGGYRFRVTAHWKGTPPAELVTHWGGRGRMASESDVGRTFLVFATEHEGRFASNRCGSSRPIQQAAATLAELPRLGLRRTTP